MPTPKIDSHQHFWNYTPEEYGWIDDSIANLRTDFLPQDLRPLLEHAGYQGCIAVQARQTPQENTFLLGLAETDQSIVGVVGWADLRSPTVTAELETLAANPLLVGIRHIVQAEPSGFMDGTAFRNGISALGRFGLAYDILVYHPQLPEAIDLCRAFPEQRFVLDHLGKPDVRNRQGHAEWVRNLRSLAQCPNAFCKLSGLTFEAHWDTWDTDTLRPYVDHALSCFGPERCMVGSDWPVSLAAGDYRKTIAALEAITEGLSQHEQDQVLGGTASRFYRLRPPSPE